MKREKIIVLDVEGMGGVCPYNVGYIVADRYGTIYKERSFALLENVAVNIYECNRVQQAIEMTARNIQEILSDFKNSYFKRKYKAVSNSDFKKKLIKDIEKHKVKKIYAYNVSFDKKSLQNLFGDDFDTVFRGIEFIDIIPIILHTKLLTKKYCKFCIENGFITEKRNIMTKAEIVYRYLFNNLTFIEEHTGLADCKIEYKILLKAFQTHKKINYKPCQAWYELKKFCKTNNIEVTA